MANGYPLAAVAGRAEVMEQIAHDIFISSTFGGHRRAGGVAGDDAAGSARAGSSSTCGARELAHRGVQRAGSEHEVPARMTASHPDG